MFSATNYTSQQGSNAKRVSIGNVDLYFSYDVLVAVDDQDANLYATLQKYSLTTARHMHQITGIEKAIRVSQRDLEYIALVSLAQEMKEQLSAEHVGGRLPKIVVKDNNVMVAIQQ